MPVRRRPDAPSEDEPPLGEFLAHMHQRRRGAMAIFGGALTAALLLAAAYPAHYRATAAIAVMPSPEFTVREDAGSHAYASTALAFDQIMEAETAILHSDDLHEATIGQLAGVDGEGAAASVRGVAVLYPDLLPAEKPNPVSRAWRSVIQTLLAPWRGAPGVDLPMDAALRRFEDALRVLPTKDGNVITVNFVHTDARLAARTLNLMLSHYAYRRRNLYKDPQLVVAQREADSAAGAVREADRALQAFKSASGFSDYDVERDLLLKRRSQAAQSLADARAMRAQAQARLGALDRQLATLPSSAPLFQEKDTDQRLQTLDDSLVELHGRMIAAQEHYRDGSHVITSLQTQIKAREAERARMVREPAPSVARNGRSPILDPLLLSRAQSFADRDAAHAQSDSIQQEMVAIAAALSSLDAAEGRLADLTRRKEAAQEAYASTSRAASEQKLTEAEDARRLANVRIIQPARVPDHQTLTKFLICLAGLVFSGLTALGWLIVKFVSETTFLTGPGLEHASGLSVLAVFEEDAALVR